MAIVSTDDVKTFLRIDHEDDDALIDALIPQVEDHYREIRGASFEEDDDGNTVYPRGSELTAALMVGYQMDRVKGSLDMESESLGDYSYSRAATGDTEYPAHIIGNIRRYVRAH